MADSKPDCGDFIIAAIRALRSNPSNLEKNKGSGVRLMRLWAVASEVYSEGECRDALNQKLRDGSIVAIRRDYDVEPKETGNYSFRIHQMLDISDQMPLNARFSDTNGKFLTDVHGLATYTVIQWVKLYVVADGLPKYVSKIQTSSSAKLASYIIATMTNPSRKTGQ